MGKKKFGMNPALGGKKPLNSVIGSDLRRLMYEERLGARIKTALLNVARDVHYRVPAGIVGEIIRLEKNGLKDTDADSDMPEGISKLLVYGMRNGQHFENIAKVGARIPGFDGLVFEALWAEDLLECGARMLKRLGKIEWYANELIEEIPRPSSDSRAPRVFEALAKADPETVAPILVRRLHHTLVGDYVKLRLESLGAQALPALEEGLDDPELRSRCFEIIASMGRNAAPAVLTACGYPDLNARARSWLRQNAAASAPLLAAALAGGQARSDIVEAFDELDELGEGAAVHALRQAKESAQLAAYFARRGAGAAPRIVSAIDSSFSKPEQAAVAGILVSIGQEGVLLALRSSAKIWERYPERRAVLAAVLGEALLGIGPEAPRRCVPLLAEDGLCEVAEATLRFQGESAVPTLAEALREESLVFSAAKLLAEIGEAGISAFTDAISGEEERSRLFSALADDGERGVTALVAFHEAETLRPLIAPLLANVKPSPLKIFYKRAAIEKDDKRLDALCRSIAAFGTAALPEALELRVRSRPAALKIVAFIGSPCIPELRTALASNSDSLRDFAVDAIKAMGPNAEPELVSLFEREGSGRVRAKLALLIGEIPTRGAFDALHTSISIDREASVRAAAVSAMEKYNSAYHDEVIAILKYALGDADHTVQASALRVARVLKRQAAELRPAIEALRSSRNQQLRSAAENTLAAVGKP